MRGVVLSSFGALALIMTACAPVPDSGAVVYLEPVSPNARAARNAALEGNGAVVASDPGGAPLSALSPGATPQTLGDDGTYTGDAPVITHVTPTAVPVPQAQTEPVPSRPSSSDGPSVVGFALATSHPVGQSVYPRSNGSTERAERGCARYSSDDQAQAAFLNSGGPEQDKQGIDPDGDGYACAWDPERFRKAVR